MTPHEQQAMTRAIRDGLVDVVGELRELRHVIAEWIAIDLASQAGPPPEVDALCVHPEEARVDFGTTKGQPHWSCRLCGFQSIDTEVRA